MEDALASVDAGRMPHVFPVDSFPSESADGMTVGENGEHVGSGFNQDQVHRAGSFLACINALMSCSAFRLQGMCPDWTAWSNIPSMESSSNGKPKEHLYRIRLTVSICRSDTCSRLLAPASYPWAKASIGSSDWWNEYRIAYASQRYSSDCVVTSECSFGICVE